MQSSLYTGISGLNANMSNLSVIGNNISNVNTVGFKGSRVTFGDVLSQTLSGGSGTNQVGLGVQMGSIQKVFNQGAFETTGNTLDLAISGNGFYMVADPTLSSTYYTRAGQFSTEKDGFIVNPEGLRLQGYLANAAGTLQNTVSDLQLTTKTITPSATTSAILNANLDSNTPVTGFVFTAGTNDQISFDVAGTPATASLVTDGGLVSGAAATGDEVAAAIKSALQAQNGNGDTYTVDYDDQTGIFTISNDTGNAADITIDWGASTAQTLLGYGAVASSAITVGADDAAAAKAAGGAFDLNSAGDTSNFSTPVTVYDSPAGGFNFTGGALQSQMIGFDFGTSITQGGTGTDGTTQYGTTSGVSRLTQDGYSSGTLQRISIDQDGVLKGIFSNGKDLTLGQVLLADFSSPTALASSGMNLYKETYDSGQPLIGAPGSAGRGLVKSSTLELSNVDIAREFVNMITAQRGFQANSKIITTTDELLAELVNLKR